MSFDINPLVPMRRTDKARCRAAKLIQNCTSYLT